MNSSPWENPVKKLLRERQPCMGATITIPSPEVAAQCANMGFDFLWIEMEHSPITLETLRNMVLATRGLKAVPFARVPINQVWLAKRVLDAGVLGVIFPFTTSAELARQAVASCKYKPEGCRGVGPGLASFRWPSAEYSDFADSNVAVIIMIEEKEAIEEIEEIAATPGVDGIYIGTTDLSYSYGHRGKMDHPEVREGIQRVVEACQKHNVPVGRPGLSPERIQEFLKQGFSFFQSPSDLVMLSGGASTYLKPLDKVGFDPAKQPLY